MANFIALYGGSFNLPTVTHRAIGVAVRDQVKPDQVWYLVAAQNPHKSVEGMVDFEHRLAMVRLNIIDEPKLSVSDLERELQKDAESTRTADILEGLLAKFPETRFAWVMGADCLANLHSWGRYDYILSHIPLIIVPRKGWTQQAITSPASRHHAVHRVHAAEDLRTEKGWYLLDFPEDDVSATNARTLISRGQQPETVRSEVYDYALNQKLFL